MFISQYYQNVKQHSEYDDDR
ncbi:hypothetical protein XAP7430_90002 [Xanthomonas phaseoli pv. phaseoli]|uniref:Uncharacterized protein n=1 Tax=Xanthomonas campestris pv. phaseoli TaxID=317013 RepID=A0AB38E7E5_XANCH|nr:hypothetical protein XAP7430_90002 [Xanthomonas phaseoli pv. phaseoli]